MKIISIVGARPNFMKIAPFVHAIAKYNKNRKSEVSDQRSDVSDHQPETSDQHVTPEACEGGRPATSDQRHIDHILVHTGQHYDERMSKSFFDALDIPRPDIDLEIGSGTHAEQVGRTMIEFEKVVKQHKPDWIDTVTNNFTRYNHQSLFPY